MTDFPTDYDPEWSQGALSSNYTNWFEGELGSPDGALWATYLFYLHIKDNPLFENDEEGLRTVVEQFHEALEDGSFSVANLFTAANFNTKGMDDVEDAREAIQDGMNEPSPTISILGEGDDVDALNALLANFNLSGLFDAESLEIHQWDTEAGGGKNAFTIEHYRSFYMEMEEPDSFQDWLSDWWNEEPIIENAPPEDIFLSYHDEIVAATDSGNDTGTGTIIATLHVLDPDDSPESFGLNAFRIVDPNDPDNMNFEHPLLEIIQDGENGPIVLKLKDDAEIHHNDTSDFQVIIEVTDSAENTYTETFNFVVGSNSAEDLAAEDDLDNVMFGFSGGDTLRGGDGDDILLAGNGHDTLIGGAGADTLVGNQGNDTFVWEAGDMAGTNVEHPEGRYDTIVDWDNTQGGGSNSINIVALLADFGFDLGDDVDDWVNLVQDGDDTIVQIDPTGSGENWENLVRILGVDAGDIDGSIVYQ